MISGLPPEPYPILCFNYGSSSLKFALYLLENNGESLLAEGEGTRIGMSDGRLRIHGKKKELLQDIQRDFADAESAIQAIFTVLGQSGLPKPAAVGHRVVHGGADHTAPAKVDLSLLKTLRGLVPFAPLHLPNEIRIMEAVAGHFPEIPQVACFDTAFHRRMPELAQRLPLAREFWEQGLRRYGFHGLSYEYILDVLGAAVGRRAIIAHLGNGASMVAVYNGQPVDTTMGFTPTGGFMMGTRSGDLDPGILLYLMNERGYDGAGIERLVNQEAGLLGVSRISSDMQTLLEKRKNEPHAAQAVEMFCYQVRKHLGALAAILGGLDMLIFTGGIGENAAFVRGSVCQGLEHLGVHINPAQNELNAETISRAESPCIVRVIRTNEDLIVARDTRKLLLSAGGA